MQGFSCRQLDEEESWLSVDYQISCQSDWYLAFMLLGIIGVCAFPIGIPSMAMFVLVKNREGIRTGDAAFERYEFLVADYKPDFYFWDCLGIPAPTSTPPHSHPPPLPILTPSVSCFVQRCYARPP